MLRSGSTIQSVRPSALRATREMGEARAVLDAHEQQRLALELGDGGIEDGVDGVRPVGRREDRVSLIACATAPLAQPSQLSNLQLKMPISIGTFARAPHST